MRSRTAALTDAQRRGLERLRSLGGSCGYDDFFLPNGRCAVRANTLDALEDRGLIAWLRPGRRDAPWFALTGAGRDALDAA